MEQNIINTGSITYAIRGRDILRSYGCKAYMFRKSGKDAVGCGYSISTDCEKGKIEKILQENGVKYISIDSGVAR